MNSPVADKRTQARELAMQALCQLDVQGRDVLPWLGGFFREQTNDSAVIELAERWTSGAWEHSEDCDKYIGQAATKWSLSRMSQVDRCILRLAVYQLKYCSDIPDKVVINEAIELAKKYSTEQSSRFVNGVLDAVMKQVKSQTEDVGPKDLCEG